MNAAMPLDPVATGVRHHPDLTALEDGEGRSWTYAELDRRVGETARRLVALGAGRGTRVALLMSPRWESVPALHGVVRCGAALAPLSPRWTAAELADAVEALRPAVVVCEAATEAAAIEAAGRAGLRSTPLVSIDPGDKVRGLDEMEPADGVATGIDPDAVAAVLWTSGTGGGRRGVELVWSAVLRHIQAVKDSLDLGPEDRWHAGLSLAHVGGLMLVLRAAALGSRLVADGGFDASALARLVDEGRVSHASLVPVMLRRLMDARAGRPSPEGLECLLVGGAHTPWNLLDEALEAGYPVALTYGMTEACSQVATAAPDLVRQKPGTVGSALDGVEMRIQGVGGEEAGEILIRGETLARGYLDGEGLLDGDGWYHSGDLGRYDQDGHLWIMGRVSDRIISGGVTVDPAEVEEALRSHPRIADAVVVGLPDEEWGERVVAAVVPSEKAGMMDSEGLEDLLDPFLRERLSSAKRPRTLRRIASVPRNPNGKVDRQAVARLFQHGSDEAVG